jgi:hypothetical protein
MRRKFLPVAVISGKERPVDRKQMAAVAPQGVVLVFPPEPPVAAMNRVERPASRARLIWARRSEPFHEKVGRCQRKSAHEFCFLPLRFLEQSIFRAVPSLSGTRR